MTFNVSIQDKTSGSSNFSFLVIELAVQKYDRRHTYGLQIRVNNNRTKH